MKKKLINKKKIIKYKFKLFILICMILIGLFILLRQYDINKLNGIDEIKIGVILPLSGNMKDFGMEYKRGIELAVEGINNKGGIYGRPIVLFYKDSKYDKQESIESVKQLINNENIEIVFAYSDIEAISISSIVKENDILLFNQGFSSVLTNLESNNFRNSISHWVLGESMMTYMNSFESIVVLFEMDYESTSMINHFADINNNTINVVYQSSFMVEKTNFSKYIEKINTKQPQAVLYVGSSTIALESFLKQIKESQINTKVYTSDVILQLEDLSYANNVNFIALAPNNDKKMQNQWKALQLEYQNKYNSSIVYDDIVKKGYDSVNIISKAVKRNGYNSIEISDYLYDMNKFNGFLGKYSFDENGDVTGLEYSLYQVVDNKVELIE